MSRLRNRLFTRCAAATVALALAGAAHAVDLRDWGRKYNTASERYAVLASFNSEAVLDKETQLVWQRAPSSATVWANALTYCIMSGTGGRQGWRLPSISELASLTGSGGVLPAGHPFQNLSAQEYFWSSTDRATDPTVVAYARQLLASWTAPTAKSGFLRYLCVRGVGVVNR